MLIFCERRRGYQGAALRAAPLFSPICILFLLMDFPRTDDVDKEHYWGGLQKIFTPEGHYLCVCEEHAKE